METIISQISQIPKQAEGVRKYVEKSIEMEQTDSILSYACLYHAASVLAQKIDEDCAVNEYVSLLLSVLEEKKKSLDRTVSLFDYTKENAEKYFYSAKKNDDSLSSIDYFLTSALLFSILSSFGTVEDEQRACIKYAKWRALEIIKERRRPKTKSPEDIKKVENICKKESNIPIEERVLQINSHLHAEEECSIALSSIKHRDIPTAIEHIKKTLSILKEISGVCRETL